MNNIDDWDETDDWEGIIDDWDDKPNNEYNEHNDNVYNNTYINFDILTEVLQHM